MTIFFYDLSPSFLWPALHQAHCLYHLYSVKPRPPGAMRLRTRGHDFEVPIIKYEFNKRNFIVQLLFNYAFFCVLLHYLHFVFYCTHVQMSYVLNSYLLTYLTTSCCILLTSGIHYCQYYKCFKNVCKYSTKYSMVH